MPTLKKRNRPVLPDLRKDVVQVPTRRSRHTRPEMIIHTENTDRQTSGDECVLLGQDGKRADTFLKIL